MTISFRNSSRSVRRRAAVSVCAAALGVLLSGCSYFTAPPPAPTPAAPSAPAPASPAKAKEARTGPTTFGDLLISGNPQVIGKVQTVSGDSSVVRFGSWAERSRSPEVVIARLLAENPDLAWSNDDTVVASGGSLLRATTQVREGRQLRRISVEASPGYQGVGTLLRAFDVTYALNAARRPVVDQPPGG